MASRSSRVFPGDLAIEERLASLMRWNALAMVVRANQAYGELGGHIASYASAADLFEVGFNHFFHAREGLGAGAAPGRPGVLPAAQRARRLRPRLPGRALDEQRPEALPAGAHRPGPGRARLSAATRTPG
jgi:pyruvate dehydrogenase E1 component